MIYSYNVTLQRYRKLFEIDKKSSGGRVISKNKYCETLVSINTNKQYFFMNFQLDAFFKSPYLFEVGVYFRHMHLWRDPHVRESPGSLTPSVFLRHPVKPYKNNQNFQSVESSFTVFFLRKKPRRKKVLTPRPWYLTNPSVCAETMVGNHAPISISRRLSP